MSRLEEIKKPLEKELTRCEQYMKDALHSGNGLVDSMLTYILDSRGKAVRPLMTMLSASMFRKTEELPQTSYLAAMLIEMIHTASLVHDDVIDESDMRRGKPSVNAIWRTQQAVLIGDYILARSFCIGMESGHFPLVKYISGSMSELCEGELIQSEQSDLLGMTREIYDRIIYKKTATLFGVSCGAGAMSVNAPQQTVLSMQQAGDSIGMAFQIQDDILDYTPSSNTGKPSGGDIRERKINLPLLLVLERSGQCEKTSLLELLDGVRENPQNVEILCKIIRERGGLQMAAREMELHTSKAREILRSFPESMYRDSLLSLVDYISDRKN